MRPLTLVNPDGASPTIVQDIPIWDFNWQGSYEYVEPVPVKEGDILRVTCTWDNTNESDPNDYRYMTWGEGTNDEMCLNVATFKPADGFAEMEGGALFVNSLAIFPDWLPSWGRVGMLGLALLPAVIQLLLAAVVIVLVAAAFLFIKRVDVRQIFRELGPLKTKREHRS